MKTAVIALAAVAMLLCSTVVKGADAEQESWTDHFDFSGDFRLRYERVDEEFEANKSRMRFRARFGFATSPSDDVKFVLRIATGGDNPVSTNQSFGEGFSGRDLRLDLAYVDWKIRDGLNVHGGKIKNPLFKAGGVPLIWDGDLMPEGVALKYSSGKLFATVGGFSVERRNSSDDSLLYVAQLGAKFPISERNSLTVGTGYFAYTDTVGNSPFYNSKAKGNTLDDDGLYVHEYKDVEVFAQFNSMLRDWPVQVFAHAVQNSAVGTQDTAIAFGAKLGSAKDRGQAQFSWTYQDIDADAVIGTFNDSDFGGGGTDSSGHLLKAKYAYAKNVFLGGTFFVNEVERFQGSEHDYSRVQFDLEIKFD